MNYILQENRSIVKPAMASWRQESSHPRTEGNRVCWLFPVISEPMNALSHERRTYVNLLLDASKGAMPDCY
jgi:hypothetical protein